MRKYNVCTDCTPWHVQDCGSCFGWGFKKGTQTPIAAAEVDKLTECDPCPECCGDLKNAHLYELEKESREFKPIKYKIESVRGTAP